MVSWRTDSRTDAECFQLANAIEVIESLARLFETRNRIARPLGAISKEAQLLESAASDDTSNIPFTSEEKAYIVQGVNEIKQYLLTAQA
jgi:hypothetical protein